MRLKADTLPKGRSVVRLREVRRRTGVIWAFTCRGGVVSLRVRHIGLSEVNLCLPRLLHCREILGETNAVCQSAVRIIQDKGDKEVSVGGQGRHVQSMVMLSPAAMYARCAFVCETEIAVELPVTVFMQRAEHVVIVRRLRCWTRSHRLLEHVKELASSSVTVRLDRLCNWGEFEKRGFQRLMAFCAVSVPYTRKMNSRWVSRSSHRHFVQPRPQPPSSSFPLQTPCHWSMPPITSSHFSLPSSLFPHYRCHTPASSCAPISYPSRTSVPAPLSQPRFPAAESMNLQAGSMWMALSTPPRWPGIMVKGTAGRLRFAVEAERS